MGVHRLHRFYLSLSRSKEGLKKERQLLVLSLLMLMAFGSASEGCEKQCCPKGERCSLR